nr:hypothetical protein [Candidatus Sigynarchaeum springense]
MANPTDPTPSPAPPGQPGRHPRPDLPQATWDAIAAAVQEYLATSGDPAPGFVAIARACRAARRAGRIPDCSNQQLAAALAYLADAGELGVPSRPDRDGTAAPAPATAPKSDPLRVNINRFLDVVYDEQAQRARVLVGGKPFLHCSFVVASIPAGSDKNIDSIDDLAASLAHDARVLEGPDVRKWLTPAEEVLAHASNLQAWAEHDYDTRLLHSNIAFPLLKELSKAGDEKATRVLTVNIDERINSGSPASLSAIMTSCFKILTDEQLTAITMKLGDYNTQSSFSLEEKEYLILTRNPPVTLLESLARHNDEEIRLCVARRDNLPEHVIKQLATDDAMIIRSEIAAKENLPSMLIVQLAHDEEPEVRSIIARRIHWIGLDSEILKQLAKDKDAIVREVLAECDNLPTNIMGILSEDQEVRVRCILTNNKSIPISILVKLAHDADEVVRKGVFFNISERKELNKDNVRELLKVNDILILDALSHRQNIPQEIRDEITLCKKEKEKRN